MKYKSLLDAIGNTPLVRIPFDSPATVYAKLEYLNPGGSIKDRTALYMIEQAEKRGTLKPGGTIIEASSGNQGIAAAMIGAIKGYKVIITVAKKVSAEKKAALQAYGAQLIECAVTTRLDDPNSYHAMAVKIHNETPNSVLLNQYHNHDNVQAHYNLTGPEIWKQLNGNFTHLVGAIGTTGTMSGIGTYLKEKNPAIKILAVDAANSYRSTNGNPKPYALEGLGVDFESPIIKKDVIDEYLLAPDEHAIAMMKRMAREYGFLIGPSSGAVAYCASEYAKQLTADDTMIILFADSGRAYLSKDYFQNS